MRIHFYLHIFLFLCGLQVEEKETGIEADTEIEAAAEEAEVEAEVETEDGEHEIALGGQLDDSEIENFTFEFKDIVEDYANDISRLLLTLTKRGDNYELSHAIAEQGSVGTAIVCEGGDDVFAFATILPLSKYGEIDILKSIVGDLLDEMKKLPADGETATIISACVGGEEASHTAIMIHGRYMNLPISLIPNLHGQLLDDINWARDEESRGNSLIEKGSTTEINDDGKAKAAMYSNVEYILLLSQCSRHAQQDGNLTELSVDVTGDSSILFEHFEDEIYCQESLASVIFSPKCADTTVIAALIPISSLSTCSKNLRVMLG